MAKETKADYFRVSQENNVYKLGKHLIGKL